MEDDTVMNMNNCYVLDTLTDSKRIEMKQMIGYCIMDNPRLVDIQFANAKFDDDWFVNDLLPVISEHGQMLTQLLLDNNPLKDPSIEALAQYVASNPPCLRVLSSKICITISRLLSLNSF
eukprot:TRINITY_DN1459_c0_g1_i1.p1 TRINITY_DN1459_c0_g1~~TRINITY_DN1459_c0_g1_i1.p1  ORF type:complete len:120 (-),score=13.20 TRINITY_DN1459_c0_g1_i1:288-647(-)